MNIVIVMFWVIGSVCQLINNYMVNRVGYGFWIGSVAVGLSWIALAIERLK